MSMVGLHPGKYAASTKPKRNLTAYKSAAFLQAAVAVEIAPTESSGIRRYAVVSYLQAMDMDRPLPT